MQFKKSLLAGGLLAVLGAGSLVGLASAAGPKPVDGQVGALKAVHQKKIADRLQQAVEAGKLTAEQRDLILAKLKELQAFRESLKDKTPKERHQALKQKHQELKTWAKDNKIPLPLLHRKHGPHGPKAHLKAHLRHKHKLQQEFQGKK